MGRAVILGNGRLTVGLNEIGMVHDFYYPFVGQENLTTARSMHHRIGVSVDKTFSWVDGDDWGCQVDLSDGALVATTSMINPHQEVELASTDFVDYEYNAFCRRIKVTNNSSSVKTIRLFMHQVFEISNHGRADTALYVPGHNYILDYKGRCSLLISGSNLQDNTSFDQFAVGNYGLEGKSGTYADAEDGELSGNTVEHGGVDSVIRFSLTLEPGKAESIDYWVIAAESQYECEKINETLKQGLFTRINMNLLYWNNWFMQSKPLDHIPADRQKLIKKSLLVIKAHCDARGGIIASCDSSIYNYGRDYYSYVWPRDGSLAIWPLIRMGFYEEAKSFFNFCRDIITIEGFLMHKYQPDRTVGSTWHPLIHNSVEELPIQEDETAITIFMLGEYLHYSNDEDFVRQMFNGYVVPAANFLASFIDEQTGLPHASYDLWEERFLTSTYTTACTYAGLLTAAELAQKLGKSEVATIWLKAAELIKNSRAAFTNPENGTLRKGLLLDSTTGDLTYDNTLDCSSFWGGMIFGYYEPEEHSLLQSTVDTMIQTLSLDRVEHTGIVRYLGDYYFKAEHEEYGNPWIVTTMWLAQYYIRSSNKYQAEKLLQVAEASTLPSGIMPEQMSSTNRSPISVTPLVWSHAEYINTILDFYTKFKD